MTTLMLAEQNDILPNLNQWLYNLTMISNNLTDPTGQAQVLVTNMITLVQQVIETIQAQNAYFDYLTGNQTATIVSDLQFFDVQAQTLPSFINSEIIPEAMTIITLVRRALQSAKCASISDTFDATYWNVCYWNNSSIAVIGVSSFVVAILLFIMFPVSCMARKRYEEIDEQSLYDSHFLLEKGDRSDTYGT